MRVLLAARASKATILIASLLALAFSPVVRSRGDSGPNRFCQPSPSMGCPPPCGSQSSYECEFFPTWTVGYCQYNGGSTTCQEQDFDCGLRILCGGIPTMQSCSIVKTCMDY